MNSAEVRQKFLDFFKERGHTIVPSSPLVTDDPSVLFTTAGMQQFKPYYLGKPSPFGPNTASSQKCVRTSDIDEVGDDTHLTFFEMLGNFSFGGYWKEDAIKYAYDFITKELSLTIDYVSVFEGDSETPADNESRAIWAKLDPSLKIKDHNRADNFWGPTGEEGPCGPTTEVYVNGVEIWNIVFNEYYKSKDGTFKKLDQTGIDTGMGLERLLVQVEGKQNVFETDLFAPILEVAGSRVVADHVRSAVFMISDGVRPSNTERGYILRRLLRRAYMHNKDLEPVVRAVTSHPSYKNVYEFNTDGVLSVVNEEIEKFKETLDAGLKEFEKGTDPFVLFTSYGFPFELTQELAKGKGREVDEEDFKKKFKEHQTLSRAGAEQKFKGGLAGHSETEVKYHTATHLLHQALRDVLGNEVSQKGSNITPERLRFDFAFPRKMTEEEKQKVENIVNEKIKAALPMQNVILSKEEAVKSGALHFFDQKYPDEVSVYYIGDSLESAYSKEFCGGPHVKNTSELGHFKIAKEEAVSAGVRRVKAVLE